MPNINDLKNDADKSFSAFLKCCRESGYSDQWDAYKNEKKWPSKLVKCHADYIKDLHTYYLARDGKKGFLGGRGANPMRKFMKNPLSKDRFYKSDISFMETDGIRTYPLYSYETKDALYDIVVHDDGHMRFRKNMGKWSLVPEKIHLAIIDHFSIPRFRSNPRRVNLKTIRHLSVPEKHQLKIARYTLKMSDVGARIMGGMTKEEARQVIKRATGRTEKSNPRRRRRKPLTKKYRRNCGCGIKKYKRSR